MKNYLRAFMAITCIACLTMSFACSKKQVKDNTLTAPIASQQDQAATGTEDPTLEESALGSEGFKEIQDSQTEMLAVFQNVLFDYDDFSLRPDAKKTINGIAEWLLQNPSTHILVEGHCDERGTSDYNLALGERRAKSVKKYLAQLSVSQKRISTITYGDERPLDPGHNEAAWTINRRSHFLIR